MRLELIGAHKSYGSGAVGADGVDLVVGAGELVALFGPSGSGKTTLLHLLGLLHRPDGGEVRLHGRRIDDLPERELAAIRRTELGYMFQSNGLLPLLSAYENVDVPLRLNGVPARDARVRIAEALNTVGLGGTETRRPEEMSGGEQQRVALARALVHEPSFVLADEPTGELDRMTGAGVWKLLRNVAERGTGVIVATHDPAALDAAHRSLFVADGTIHEPGRSELRAWAGDLPAGGARGVR